MRLMFFSILLCTISPLLHAAQDVFTFEGEVSITDSKLKRLVGDEIEYSGEITFDYAASPYEGTNPEPHIYESDHYPYLSLKMKLNGAKIKRDREDMDAVPEHTYMIIVGDGKQSSERDQISFIISINEPTRINREYFRLWIQPIANNSFSSFSGTDLDLVKLAASKTLPNKRVIIMLEHIRTGDLYLTSAVDTNPRYSFSSGGSDSVTEFVWPVATDLNASGHFGPCADNPDCYWLSDSSEDTNTTWRDVQPFLRHVFVNSKGKDRYHLGADYNLGAGDNELYRKEPVYPIGDGEILKTYTNRCYWGNIIFVKHETAEGPITSMYAHVDWLEGGPPKRDAPVSPDTPIATVGKGQSSCYPKGYDAHLHFEVRKGTNLTVGRGYQSDRVGPGPQGQIDPNEFIRTH